MKVTWDYYSQYMEKNVPNHQQVFHHPRYGKRLKHFDSLEPRVGKENKWK